MNHLGKRLFFVIAVIALIFAFVLPTVFKSQEKVVSKPKEYHWFLLHRKSNVEYFYYGQPGDKGKSKLVKKFAVKTGIPGERPTPLPQLAGREYWLVIKKEPSADNPETAPFFLTLNVPGIEEEPFGPSPYKECIGPDGEKGGQCNWNLPGAFGLHGVNGDPLRLSNENPGSSGCVRHTDEDITYLYKTLNPENEEIRYYIEDL